MEIIVKWNAKFKKDRFIADVCSMCPCCNKKTGMCTSPCLCGDELPVSEAVERLYKPRYSREIRRRYVILEVNGFYCEGRSMATLDTDQPEDLRSYIPQT